MSRLQISALTLLILFSAPVHGASGLQEMEELASRIEAFGPRYEGSPGEVRTLDYLEEVMKGLGAQVRRIPLESLPDAHSFSSNLEVLFPGRTEDQLILAIPLNHPNPEVPQGEVSLATAVTVARKYEASSRNLSLRILFLGGERGFGDPYPLGTRSFLEEFFPQAPVSLLYLDVQEASRQLKLQVNGMGRTSPIWMVRGLAGVLEGGVFSYFMEGSHPPLLRLSLAEAPSQLDPYFQKEIPGLVIRSGEGDSLPRGMWINETSESVLKFMERFPDGLPGTWDRHYLMFQWQDQYFILDQRTYIILLLGVFGLILVLLMVRTAFLKDMVRSVAPHFWQIPLVFASLFLFLYGATILLQLLLEYRDFPSLWESFPTLFLGLKLSVALFIYYLLFAAFRRMPLMRWSTFYVAAALVITGILTLLSLATGLANSFYFLWSLVITILFALWTNRFWRLGLLTLLPLWFLKAVGESFLQSPDAVLIRAVLFSPVEGNLILALLTLPMVNLLSAYHFMSHQKQGRYEQAWNEAFMTLTALFALVLSLGILQAQPYGEDKKVPLVWEDVQREGLREIRVSSSLPWSEGKLILQGIDLPMPAGLREVLYEAPPITGAQVNFSTRDYLERRDWNFRLEAPGQPDKVELVVSSPDPLVIHGSPFPYRILPGERQARLFIGRFPPSPLELTLTLAPVSRLELEWTLSYNRLPYQVEGLPDHMDFQGTLNLLIRQSLEGRAP